ncbi:Protein of unknown function [Gryllus bimaculatus]|nr:Protein of unknown function [Gryllus bimaculatus]
MPLRLPSMVTGRDVSVNAHREDEHVQDIPLLLSGYPFLRIMAKLVAGAGEACHNSIATPEGEYLSGVCVPPFICSRNSDGHSLENGIFLSIL